MDALFVFGAGATRGASFVDANKCPCLPPLDADFFTQLQRIQNKKYQELISEVMSSVVKLFGPNFDITMEMMFGILEHTERMIKATGATGGLRLPSYKKIRKQLIQAVAAVFEESLTEKNKTDATHSTLEARSCMHHTQFVKKILKPRDTIISFNYDCLIDYSLRGAGRSKWNARYGYGIRQGRGGHQLKGDGYWQPIEGGKLIGEKNTVKLFKLHGSLHFQVDNQNARGSAVTLKERPYTKQAGDNIFSIIPPESNKKYDSEWFRNLWIQARKAIAEARHIIVVGYSFPATDLHSSTLFRTGVKPKNLRSLIVVNPDRNARKRIRSIFREGLSERTKILSFDYLSEFTALDRNVWNPMQTRKRVKK